MFSHFNFFYCLELSREEDLILEPELSTASKHYYTKLAYNLFAQNMEEAES